jgi:hypothetical protein
MRYWQSYFECVQPKSLQKCLSLTKNLSFGFICIENGRDREADFVNKDEGNSRSTISEDLFAKDDHEVARFQAKKLKIQVKMKLNFKKVQPYV